MFELLPPGHKRSPPWYRLSGASCEASNPYVMGDRGVASGTIEKDNALCFNTELQKTDRS